MNCPTCGYDFDPTTGLECPRCGEALDCTAVTCEECGACTGVFGSIQRRLRTGSSEES